MAWNTIRSLKGPNRWPFFLVIIFSLSYVLFYTQHGLSTTRTHKTQVLPRTSEAVAYPDSINATYELERRQSDDPYSCGPSKPCKNGACCGGSGFCGYGATYCGTGCVSNCGAHAECGKDAVVPGTECPLKTCCSQYGFCGTTEDFCKTSCQSNCVLHPTPPGGASAIANILENKVIGYYESWSARKDCHKVGPTGIALDALTHVNFAFASISVGSYKLVPMDGQTPESLFKEVPNLKQIKPSLKVFISVGGWTFSDNGTVTQPLFGEIAGSATNRRTFSNNVVSFMKQYGYDGIDIDWEYPGAPDRGGKPEDVQNFVLLLKDMRAIFDASGSKFGITFTAPSSYWYLKWFDLPNLIKYADWINLMSYDLHGVWDRDNPIGSIVQGHTNLTEIKTAFELYWRVGIAPSKIVMGFGFYGRSFTLADPSCNKPGCQFSGASIKGPCTGEGGILGHYEIQEVLRSNSKKRAFTPVHDKVAAVKYFTFDNDQWVSYDDKDTMKQKVDWANGIGLGGALIWASDLDDDKYSAHGDLMGRTIKSTAVLNDVNKALSNPQALIQDLGGTNGQDCFIYTGKCVNLNDNKAMSDACGTGFTPVGWDDAGCGKKSCHCGKPVCCPSVSAPKNCVWRGQDTGGGVGSDCSAQCKPGEVNIKGIKSSWGGGFVNDGDTNKCGRGAKAFCCPSLDFGKVTKGCTYTSCTGSCPSDKEPVFSKNDACFLGTQYYCCPKPTELKSCRWEAGSKGTDCVNAICKDNELEIDRAQFAEWFTVGCSWGRTKAACCTVEKQPPKPAFCTKDPCKSIPEFCNGGVAKRDLSALGQSPSTGLIERTDLSGLQRYETRSTGLVKRGNEETYYVNLGNNVGIRIIAMAYPLLSEIFGLHGGSRVLRRFFRLIAGYCIGPAVDEGTIPGGDSPTIPPDLDAEHPIDRQVMIPFTQAVASHRLPGGASGSDYGLTVIGGQWFKDNWHTVSSALAARPAVGGPDGYAPDTCNDRLMECMGSYDYPDPLLPTDKRLNGAKAAIMRLRRPATPDRIRQLAEAAVESDHQDDADALLSPIRDGIAVFEYMNRNDFVVRFNMVRAQIRTQLRYIEQDVPGAQGLVAWWDLFSRDYFALVGQRAREWAVDVIHAAAEPFVQAQQAGRNLDMYEVVIGALEEMLNIANGDDMNLPGDFTMPNPQPPGGGGTKREEVVGFV